MEKNNQFDLPSHPWAFALAVWLTSVWKKLTDVDVSKKKEENKRWQLPFRELTLSRFTTAPLGYNSLRAREVGSLFTKSAHLFSLWKYPPPRKKTLIKFIPEYLVSSLAIDGTQNIDKNTSGPNPKALEKSEGENVCWLCSGTKTATKETEMLSLLHRQYFSVTSWKPPETSRNHSSLKMCSLQMKGLIISCYRPKVTYEELLKGFCSQKKIQWFPQSHKKYVPRSPLDAWNRG